MWFNLIFWSAHGQFHVVGGQALVPALLMHHPVLTAVVGKPLGVLGKSR